MAGFLPWRRDPAKRAAERAERDRMIAAEVLSYEQRKATEDARRAQLAADREREMCDGLPDLPRDDQGPICSRCHGRQFEAKRDAGSVISGAIAGGVAGGFLTSRDVVECVPCGKRYRRG